MDAKIDSGRQALGWRVRLQVVDVDHLALQVLGSLVKAGDL